MNINTLLAKKCMTKYKLSKISEIPYSTINDICNGKAALTNCSAGTVLRLAKTLDVTMEMLLSETQSNSFSYDKCGSFEIFKSNICHRVKDLGDIPFITELLEQDSIRTQFEKDNFPEALYLLAMLDYLSSENHLPLCTRYDDMRTCTLSEPIFPEGILTLSTITQEEKYRAESLQSAIPEFMRFNIVESEVRNVI